jgi:endonuclease YncB( thermonuclease family)
MNRQHGLSAALALVAATLMTSCGGDCLQLGGCKESAGSAPTSSTSAASPSVALAPGSNIRQFCGVDVGPFSIQSAVLDVHDGDTITVALNGAATNVRLEGIDAPELAQPFGIESRTSLSNLILNTPVTVTYATSDKYGRVLGTVFKSDCNNLNLKQLQAGMAWYYAAFQCELPLATRDQFRSAQDAAQRARIGLWSQPEPQAPWFYRNGTSPEIPSCTDSLPLWASTTLSEFDPRASFAQLYGEASGATQSVTCGTKTSCSQMTSCAEARAFLNQCGVSSLDADKDGIPCESLCK